MQKGKYGFYLWVYAVLGYVLAFLDQLVPCLLLLGFVIAAEKNEWAIKQAMQALFLCLFSELITLGPSAIRTAFAETYLLGDAISAMCYIFNVLLFFIVLAAAVIGIVNAVKGNDNGIPLLAKLANRAFGLVEKKVFYQSER